MGKLLEFQGRLCRTDGREVASGVLDLRFRLHVGPDAVNFVWEEAHAGVRVAAGGAYAVLLGEREPLDPALFDAPRWLGVSVEREGRTAEVGPRVPLTGAVLRHEEALLDLAARLDVADAQRASPFDTTGADGPARRRIVKLHRRLKRLEARAPARTDARLSAIEARVARLDDPETGRVLRLEDEVEDVVGADGDLIDLLERLEALERGHGGPMRLAAADAALTARAAAAEARIAHLEEHVELQRHAIEALLDRLAAPPAPVAPSSLPGPLTVEKGGVHVASGGLLVRSVEGRVAGASRREGPLLVNPSGGGDLLVGNKLAGAVVAATSLRASRVAGVARALAVRVGGEGPAPGDVVVWEVRRRVPTARLAQPGEAPLGVVVAAAGVELGEGPVVVAVAGVASVRVDGEPPVGATLVAGPDGVARVGEGPPVGRTLGVVVDGRVELLLRSG